MKFKCIECGHNEFELNFAQTQYFESDILTEFPEDGVIKWYDKDETDNVWAVCAKCEKEYESQWYIKDVEEQLIKIGALI